MATPLAFTMAWRFQQNVMIARGPAALALSPMGSVPSSDGFCRTTGWRRVAGLAKVDAIQAQNRLHYQVAFADARLAVL